MIVQCEKCQSRFKIPDEKVTSKGVKVRCGRCQHMFRVSKEEGSGAEGDPFARFDPNGPSDLQDKTRPGVFSKGIAATAQPEPEPEGLPADLFEVPTREQPQLKMPPELPPEPATRPAQSPALASSVWEASGFGSNAEGQPEPTLMDFGPLPTQAPEPQPQAEPDPFAQPSQGNDMSWTGVNDYGASSAPASPSDPFGASEDLSFSQAEPAPPAEAGDSVPSREELFDIPPPPPPAEPAVTQSQTPAPAAPPAAPVAPPAISSRTQPPASRLPALLANLVVTAVLLVVLAVGAVLAMNDGKLDAAAFSPARFKALLAPPSELIAKDLSSGLYETREGRPIFFVRGEAHNRGATRAKLKVRVELLDGNTLVSFAEGMAGELPSPEALYGLASGVEVEALHDKLSAAALEVEPNSSRPFLVAFYEYPPELEGFRLRVTVERAAEPRSAAR